MIKLAGGRTLLRASQASLGDPLADDVFVVEVLLRRLDHDLGRRESVRAPVGVALQHPAQDAVALFEQALAQPLVAARGRDRHAEGDEMHAPPHRLANARKPRAMVAGDDQLEGRRKLEEVALHEPRPKPVAAGDGLDSRLRPGATRLGLRDGHEALSDEPGEVGRMGIVARRHEGA